MSCKNIVSGFVSTGIFPLDETKIPEDFFDPRDLARFKNMKATMQQLQESNNDLPPKPINNEDHTLGVIVPLNDNPEDIEEGIILDLSSNRSNNEYQNESDKPTGVADMITIFSRSIKTNTASTSSVSPKKIAGTRLKHQTYGEVLTSEEVLSRLKEAEEKKRKPRKRNQMEKGTIKKKMSKKTEDYEESEEEEMLDEMLDENDFVDVETYVQNMENELLEEVNYVEPSMQEIKPNKFVLVDIEGGKRNKTHYLYVCRIDVVTLTELQVTGLKSVDSGKTKFVLVENDRFSVLKTEIKALLPSPLCY